MIASALREHGIGIGDVIEVGTHASRLSQILDGNTTFEGLVVEVTAIGETTMLGYWLQGEPKSPFDYTYGGVKWDRVGRENCFRHATTIRKVGHGRDGDYFWTQPDLVCIYQRCKEAA